MAENLQDLGINRRVILKCILKMWGVDFQLDQDRV